MAMALEAVVGVVSTPVVNFNDIIIGRPPETGLTLGGGGDSGVGGLGSIGRTRREPGQPVYSNLRDDEFPTERRDEERSDMVELLNRYAPVFKLSSVEFAPLHLSIVIEGRAASRRHMLMS